MSATPPANAVRPGDLILTRAIKWWDSGQIQRAFVGILMAAAGPLTDIIEGRTPFSWRGILSAVMGGIFVWIGISRAKSPDIVTGVATLDRANAKAFVPAQAISDLQKREAATAPKGGG